MDSTSLDPGSPLSSLCNKLYAELTSKPGATPQLLCCLFHYIRTWIPLALTQALLSLHFATSSMQRLFSLALSLVSTKQHEKNSHCAASS